MVGGMIRYAYLNEIGGGTAFACKGVDLHPDCISPGVEFPMFAFLLAWATFGMATGATSEASNSKAAATVSREWTDASGSKHVRAVLLRIEGDKLWLRRSDGKLATTTVSQLSRADR